jgi:hypothetical protein
MCGVMVLEDFNPVGISLLWIAKNCQYNAKTYHETR